MPKVTSSPLQNSCKTPLRPFGAVGGSLDGLMDTKATRAEFIKAVQRIDAALESQNQKIVTLSLNYTKLKNEVKQPSVTKGELDRVSDTLWEEIKGDRVTLKHHNQQVAALNQSCKDLWAAHEKMRDELHEKTSVMESKITEAHEMVLRLSTNAKIDYQKVSELEERVQYVEKKAGIDYFGEYGNSDVDRDDDDYGVEGSHQSESDHEHNENEYEKVTSSSPRSASDQENPLIYQSSSSSGSETDDSDGDQDNMFSKRGGGDHSFVVKRGSSEDSFDVLSPIPSPRPHIPSDAPKW